MDKKEDIIKKVYTDASGYGSQLSTLKDAQAKDNTITKDDIKSWFAQNVETKKQLKGTNSFIAPHPHYEYQLDLFFINDIENQKFKIGITMIDIFTKYATVVPIHSKSEGDVASGLMECLEKMGHKPEIIYSDDETALSTTAMQQFFKDKNISHVVTRSHAWFIERFIRTFKDMLYKRIEASSDTHIQWTDYIYQILLTYNNKMIHKSTGHTPHDAKLEKNTLNVKLNMELHGKHNRKYPELQINDKVKIYKKHRTGDKERVSVWSDNTYEVVELINKHGQNYYKLNGLEKQYLRNEILKI